MNSGVPKTPVRRILAIDCGSTTTKAILIERMQAADGTGQGDGFRLRARGEAPTTVEEPVADVLVGVANAIRDLEELSGLRLLGDTGSEFLRPATEREGIDLFVATSSAGGGLQMIVAGVVKTMSAESAARAAMGAGAIVTEVLAINDGRSAEEKIRRLQTIRPDMILLSGGTDGGATPPVVEMAELIAAADPQARSGGRLPVLFAGNIAARAQVEERLSAKTALMSVENIRPELERENLSPARQKIQDVFLEHVMSHAPGYPRLLELTDSPVLPTPAAVGELMQTVARAGSLNILGVDIGGATTDVFSIFGGQYHKSVSANLGMSYSIGNVLLEAGWERISAWLPFVHDENDLQNRIRNKMLRPTTIPARIEDLQLEQACARVAMNLAFDQHCALATGLKGVRTERGMGDAFVQSGPSAGLIDRRKIDLLIGSGGVLSHAPRRQQAAMMLIDAFQPEGVTPLAVDSVFMMPHLGALGKVQERTALEVFERDCLVRLGTCIAPWGSGTPGTTAIEVSWRSGDQEEKIVCRFGEMKLIRVASGEGIEMRLQPGSGLDLGAGPGQLLTRTVCGGEVGVILDGRGRPLIAHPPGRTRREALEGWFSALELFPEARGTK